MSNHFDDFIDSLAETDLPPAAGKPAERFPCGQCFGSGHYQGARVHQEKSHCFACRGKGYFLSSPEARRNARQAAASKKRNALETGIAAFAEQQPAMYADLLACWKFGVDSGFVMSLAGQLFQRGRLSDKQIEAWHRGKLRLEQIRAERAVEAKAAEVSVDLEPIRAMFERASASGLKKPTYRAEGLVISKAPDSGRNAGALYVVGADGSYFGKLIETTFHPVRAAPASVKDALALIAANPAEAAVAYGRKTGICCCCGRTLTDARSVEAGIGPICADKWGF